MEKIIFSVALLLASLFAQAQNVCGSWLGVVKMGNSEVTVVFNVVQTGDGFQSTMDSPSQNVKGISTTSTTFVDSILTINMDDAQIQYQARLMKNHKLNGIFTQMGKRYALSMTNQSAVSKSTTQKHATNQLSEAYSYSIDTVCFKKDGQNIVKTIVYQPIKKCKSPAVVLVCDLDKDNKNTRKYTSGLSNELCSNGYVVLCIDFFDENLALQASNYLKTCAGVNAKKVSFVILNEGNSKGNLASLMSNIAMQ
jgi:hypothetical protein